MPTTLLCALFVFSLMGLVSSFWQHHLSSWLCHLSSSWRCWDVLLFFLLTVKASSLRHRHSSSSSSSPSQHDRFESHQAVSFFLCAVPYSSSGWCLVLLPGCAFFTLLPGSLHPLLLKHAGFPPVNYSISCLSAVPVLFLASDSECMVQVAAGTS